MAKTKPGDPFRYFIDHVTDQTDECIIWPFALVDGYGQVTLLRRTFYVHALACEYANGPRYRRLATHTCRNRACFNPRHLAWGSHYTNSVTDRIRDGIKPGGSGRGHIGEKR